MNINCDTDLLPKTVKESKNYIL